MINHKLPDHDWSIYPQVIIGSELRHSTATAIAFVDENKIITAQFLSKMVYLVDITDGGFNILDSYKLKHCPDLLDYKDGLLVTANFPSLGDVNGSFSIFDVKDDKLSYRKTIVLNQSRTHGVRIINDNKLIAVDTRPDNVVLWHINIDEGKPYSSFNNFELYPKDIYLTDDKMFVPTSGSLPQIGLNTIVANTRVYVYERPSMKVIDMIEFYGQSDSIAISGQHIFVTMQSEHGVAHLTLIDNKLSYLGIIKGFRFPHGIATYADKVAVTNYGDNSIDFFTLDEFLSQQHIVYN